MFPVRYEINLYILFKGHSSLKILYNIAMSFCMFLMPFLVFCISFLISISREENNSSILFSTCVSVVVGSNLEEGITYHD
jgi:hypothetical protein